MPTPRMKLRMIKEVLRLKYDARLSHEQIALALRISKGVVTKYVGLAATAGLDTWAVIAGMDEPALRACLLRPVPRPSQVVVPDFAVMHRELSRKGVTLMLLWEEYRAEHADGYGYSRFCDLYGEWRKGITATMRQPHVAGEKLFVDFAGDTVPVIDGLTGEVRAAHVFVAVLGASNYTFAEARWSEGLADWIGAHVDALAFLGGVPKLIVCDNLKAGVTAACRYEPGINRTYQDMATHYGTSILPARVRRPRDKAKVENGVLIVERFILARLRNRRFFSLEELNQAIRELLDELNARLMRKLGASRRAFFEALDLPALKALPDEPYQYAEWKKCRVAPDYHVDLHGHLYSVPHALIREVLEARMTGTTVELFHRGRRVASHARSALRNRHTTISEHMPSSHRRYAEWTPARIAREAERVGSATAGLCAAIMRAKPHPEQGFRACLGILRLAKSYGSERLEAACRRGLDIGATTYGSIASILKSGLDRAYREEGTVEPSPIDHTNIRGGGYYH